MSSLMGFKEFCRKLEIYAPLFREALEKDQFPDDLHPSFEDWVKLFDKWMGMGAQEEFEYECHRCHTSTKWKIHDLHGLMKYCPKCES